jgi:hypothetical protein
MVPGAECRTLRRVSIGLCCVVALLRADSDLRTERKAKTRQGKREWRCFVRKSRVCFGMNENTRNGPWKDGKGRYENETV